MAVERTDRSIRLSPVSRYRNTRVYSDPEARTGKTEVFFGVWRPPTIIESRPTVKHNVAPDEINRPDLISFRVYGNPDLFWVIALRNNWLLPILDIKAGQVLECPHLDDITAAFNSSFSGNPGTA